MIRSVSGGVVMRKFIYIVALILFMPASIFAADETQSNNSIVVKSEQKSVFKGLLYSVWGKLRALSPSVNKNRNRAVVTAGVRGAETTDSIITPYWMGDKTDDPDYIKELTEYSRAQQLAEDGDLTAAVKALSDFIAGYDNSDLRPNAQFALGISYGGLGQKQPGIDALQAFVNEHPNHPLVADARQVIAELE